MKKSYLTLHPLFLPPAKLQLQHGDMLLYDTGLAKNNLSVFRGGALLKTLTHSAIGMEALESMGVIEENVDTAQYGSIEWAMKVKAMAAQHGATPAEEEQCNDAFWKVMWDV